MVKFPENSSSLPAGVPEHVFFIYRPNKLNNMVTKCKDVLVICTCINVAYVVKTFRLLLFIVKFEFVILA